MTCSSTLRHPLCDLRSDIAAEARAKAVYDRLIKLCPDSGARDALTFLMTREVAHQKMFESALAAIADNFPSSNVPPDERFTHAYFNESQDGKQSKAGFEMVNSQGLWDFKLSEPHAGGSEPDLPPPKRSVVSTEGSKSREAVSDSTSRTTKGQITGSEPATIGRSRKT